MEVMRIAKIVPCADCLKILDLTKSQSFQFCVCGSVFCSTLCFDKQKELHKHLQEGDDTSFNAMVTLLPCCICQKVTDITKKPDEEFKYCYCGQVFCSKKCLDQGSENHAQHFDKANGFPCSARSFLTEKRELFLEDRPEVCANCEEEKNDLKYFCEACKLFFCGKDIEKKRTPISCFDSHQCVSDLEEESP